MEIFITGIVFAFILKLKTSLDDIVWLGKLFSWSHKDILISIVYLSTLLLIVGLSYLLSYFWFEVLAYFWVDEKWFGIITSVLLILYAIFFLKRSEESSGDSLQEKRDESDKNIVKTTFYISFIWSIDELFVFATIFSSTNFWIWEIGIWVILAGLVVILISNGIFDTTANARKILHKIPSWFVIFLVGIYSLIANL